MLTRCVESDFSMAGNPAKIRIEPFNCADEYNGVKEDKIEIYSTIKNSIGVQIALAEILCNGSSESCIASAISFISLNDDETVQSQIKRISLVFMSVHRIFCKEKLIACEVANPITEAIEAYAQACLKGHLNPWVQLFYTGEQYNDCLESALLKYTSDTVAPLRIEEMLKETFFRYMLFSNRNLIIQPNIPLSRFQLDLVEKVPYINELACIVDNLYVLVQKDYNRSGQIQYLKYLVWDKVQV